MAKNGNGRKNEKGGKNDKKAGVGLKTQTKHGIIAVIFFVLALFFLMSYMDAAGKAGIFIYDISKMLIGAIGYFLLPTLLILLGYSFIKSEVPDIGWTRAISGVIFLLSGLGIINIAGNAGNHTGGLLGEILSTPFVSLFDIYASLVLLGALLIISILMMFDAKPNLAPFLKKIWSFFFKRKDLEISTSMPKFASVRLIMFALALMSPVFGLPLSSSRSESGGGI